MRKPEQKLWDRWRNNMPPDIYLERVENLVWSGTPDVMAMWRGKVTWVENKIAAWPKRKNTRIQFKHPPTPDQRNWHINWNQRGGTSYILVGIEQEVFLIPGLRADDVPDMMPGAIKPFAIDWDGIVKRIKRK